MCQVFNISVHITNFSLNILLSRAGHFVHVATERHCFDQFFDGSFQIRSQQCEESRVGG